MTTTVNRFVLTVVKHLNMNFVLVLEKQPIRTQYLIYTVFLLWP